MAACTASPTAWLVVLFGHIIPTAAALQVQQRTNTSSESSTTWTLLLSSTLGNTNIGDFSSGSTYGSESSYTWSDYRIGYTGSQLQAIGMFGMRVTTASGYSVEHFWTLSTSGFDNTCTSCNCGGNSLGSDYYWHGGRGGCWGSTHFGLKKEADVHSSCNVGGLEEGNAWGHFHRVHINTGVYFFGDSCINSWISTSGASGTTSGAPLRRRRPTRRHTRRPSRRPTRRHTRRPTRRPTRHPTRRPSRRLTRRPTRHPTRRPSPRPTRRLTRRPTRHPTRRPSRRLTRRPTRRLTRQPTRLPSRRHSRRLTRRPSRRHSRRPSRRPTRRPSRRPTRPPSRRPSRRPAQRRARRILWVGQRHIQLFFLELPWQEELAGA
ncbi:unnamed protein product [Prorocentrum cordatum]|uniref:Uncharacterized protein n=1 Tax=Prorocentrum cordatum TaxID=2364126 RepID=A0ABN9XCB5_9DINO|nr:unnamed protein product [Polarella glacialis]